MRFRLKTGGWLFAALSVVLLLLSLTFCGSSNTDPGLSGYMSSDDDAGPLLFALLAFVAAGTQLAIIDWHKSGLRRIIPYLLIGVMALAALQFFLTNNVSSCMSLESWASGHFLLPIRD